MISFPPFLRFSIGGCCGWIRLWSGCWWLGRCRRDDDNGACCKWLLTWPPARWIDPTWFACGWICWYRCCCGCGCPLKLPLLPLRSDEDKGKDEGVWEDESYKLISVYRLRINVAGCCRWQFDVSPPPPLINGCGWCWLWGGCGNRAFVVANPETHWPQ